MFNVRIRKSNRPTKVPYNYKAFLFRATVVDGVVYKMVIAEDFMHASCFMSNFNREQGLDLFWTFVDEDSEFPIVGSSPDYSEILF